MFLQALTTLRYIAKFFLHSVIDIDVTPWLNFFAARIPAIRMTSS